MLNIDTSKFPKGPDGKTPQWPKFWCDLANFMDLEYKDCECEYYPPYGLVISADCEKHD